MHCMVDAMDADSIGATCIGTNVVLVKLIERPVARAKSCRMFFNCWAPSFDALAMIRVSSAYCRTVGGRCEKSGWLRCDRLQSCCIIC